MKIKYIWLLLILIGFTACEDDNNITSTQPLPALTAGSADFSNFVTLGNSLTAGYTDNALFQAGQASSFPNIMAQKFALAGGGGFTQPYTNDNIGGLTLGGNLIAPPRLFFDGSGPKLLPASPTTEVSNVLSGPFNNLGVPGAKSFHLLANGYGNIGGVQAGLANPYFVRMASSPNASVLEDAMAQNASFFSLWIGNNDVLGYATTGGDGSNPITDTNMFTGAYSLLISSLTSTGAGGIVANIPDVTTIPFLTTVPYNPVPLDAATAGALNQGYALYNGGLQQAFAALNGTGLFTEEEVAKRTISFSAGEGNALVIIDEDLTDLGAINPAFAGIPQYRQATAEDLFVLTLSSLIPQGYGTQIPLADKWALTPEEQQEIATATQAFNSVIENAASQAGLAFVDANSLMTSLSTTGVSSNNFILTSDLVLGGAFSLDGVHPTSRGFALIANEMLKAIDATYGSNFEESGNLVNIGDYSTNYPPTLQ